MSRIILDPINSQLYKEDSKEPQYVTFQYQNQGEIFLDSQYCVDKITPTHLSISTKKTPTDRENTLFTNVSRVAVQSAGLFYTSPNVNPRNYEITFYSSVSNNFHTTQLVEGFYTNTTSLIDHIILRLNTLTGSTGLTFSKTVNYTDCYNLISTGGDYYFDLNCSAIKKGYQLYNLPRDQIPTNTKRVGVMGLWYTRYIDITSKQLTRYSKMPSRSTGYNQNLVERLFIGDPTKPGIIAQYQSNSSIFNYKHTDNVSVIDFQLFDQFGDPLYLGGAPWNDTDGGFFFDVNITVF